MSCKLSVIKACKCIEFKAKMLVREVTNRVQYLELNVGNGMSIGANMTAIVKMNETGVELNLTV